MIQVKKVGNITGGTHQVLLGWWLATASYGLGATASALLRAQDSFSCRIVIPWAEEWDYFFDWFSEG